jgi:hypothetical protein
MKMLSSGVVISALLSWGLPVWSPANAIAPQTHNEPGYSVWHGMSVPTVDAGGACSSKEMPVMGAG